MLIRKNEDGKKLLLPAQIAKIYTVSRPTAGKWAEMAASGENRLDIVKSSKRIFIIDNEANHKELHLLREKGVKYKNKSDYEKIEIDPDFIKTLDDISKSQLITAFENKFLPLKFAWAVSPELFGNELETKKEDLKKQRLQTKNFIELFRTYQNQISYKIVALENCDINLIEALAEGLLGHQDEPQLNITAPGQSLVDSTINKNLFGKILYTKIDFESQSLAPILHTPIANSHQGNLILLGNYLINKSQDAKLTLQNLSKTISNRDYIIFNVKLDSVAMDIYAMDYLEAEKVETRNEKLLSKMGVQPEQYILEYKYNEVLKSHQYVASWTKEIDFVFGGLNISFREGDNIVLEQLTCFTQPRLLKMIDEANLELVQMVANNENSEIVLIAKKRISKKS